MVDINKDLQQSLQTGFIDQLIHSKKEYLPQLLVNHKKEGLKFLTTIIRELNDCDEFWFSAAFITTSGVAAIINTLIELKEKNIKGKVLVSSYLNFTQPEALRRLLNFNNIDLRIAVEEDFHSKGYIFRKGQLYELIIGSSNLTAAALCTNTEWNLKVSATPNSYIINSTFNEFFYEFSRSTKVNIDFINKYQKTYQDQINISKRLYESFEISKAKEIIPNSMQIEAMNNIQRLRVEGKTKALLISATGTGKTFLSAFDAKVFNPRKLLFVVHRYNIADAALRTFKTVFGTSKSMGLYSGSKHELDKDFIFSTIQTISRDEHLKQFDPRHFDYIVIDESHRAGADTYQKIINHFQGEFLLGMTATPERTDGYDIFSLYDHNIAYEIRLHRALEEDMLSPFHYYGVTDITVDGLILEENSDFSLLTSDERVERIIEKSRLYGCDTGRVRGLIFCSRVEECKAISEGLNARGFKTVALTGESSESERADAIKNLESDSTAEYLDYILTRDIFNEGIDIPKVNQVIMLRPTQSAIVFVQQLGRGLRKADGKEYLTVIDFIGNYSNNYLVPIALYGDTSYNKDTLRKCMANGSSLLPGASTINFDKISRERIFAAIDSANMQLKKDLVNDYQLLKFKLGRVPMMVDFIDYGSRDAQLYVNYSKSYFNFVESQEETLKDNLNKNEKKLLELFSSEINNSKRIEECIILKSLQEKNSVSFKEIKDIVLRDYGYDTSNETIESCIRNINFEFITENYKKKRTSVKEIYNINVLILDQDIITFHPAFKQVLNIMIFSIFFKDNIEYSIKTFNRLFELEKFSNGFVYYRKYSRKDVFRILNWKQNPLAQNVGGYIISKDKSNCPIFVTYDKAENISNSIKYEDEFINNSEFEWMSKSKRSLKSPDVKTIMNYKTGLRIPLFIQKSNDEGAEFYYMGDITPIEGSYFQTTMRNDDNKLVSVVKMRFSMNHPVEDAIYNYITTT